MQSEASQAIIRRYYEAVDTIILKGQIRGKQTYCNLYGLDKRNFYAQRKDLTKGFFQVSWLLPLINDFQVNPSWLLTGRGMMFERSRGLDQY